MPTDDDLDKMIGSAAKALDLPLDPAWKGSIRTNLKITLAHAKAVQDFPLPDEAEPAPIFRA
ncbi:MAG: DUF4089 domain-containing protein [Pseudolabrys sp.]|nr:DUF4089 domain-containing protein [Pseudolabrys sp.]